MQTKKNIRKQNIENISPDFDFGKSIANFWKKYFYFYGTTQPNEYLFMFFCIWVIYLFLFGLIGEEGLISGFAIILLSFFAIAVFIPRLSIAARRLHDAGFSAWWLISVFIVMPLSVVGFYQMMLLDMDIEYTSDVLALVFGSFLYGLFFGYELTLFIIGLLPSKLKKNKYR